MPVAVSSIPRGAAHRREDGKESGDVLTKFFATGAMALGRLRKRNKSEDLPFAFYRICDRRTTGQVKTNFSVEHKALLPEE